MTESAEWLALRAVQKAVARRGLAGLISHSLHVARNGKDTTDVVRALKRAANQAVITAFAAGTEVGLRAADWSRNHVE